MEQSELPGVIEGWLRDALDEPQLEVADVAPPAHVSDELREAWRAEKYAGGAGRELEGLIPLDATILYPARSATAVLPLLLKARTGAGLGRTALPDWFDLAGIRLSRPLDQYPSMAEFLESRDREIAVYRLQREHEAFARYLPRRVGDRIDADRDEYLLLMERVDDAPLMDTGGDIAGWTLERVATTIDAAAALQAVWLGRTDELYGGPWPLHARDGAVITGDRELWEQLLESGRRHFPDVVDDHVYRGCRGLLDAIDDWYPARDALPRTLVHDDLNPRNSCFRADGRPLVYDWELAMLDVPQRDLAELLTFVLDPASASDKALVAYLVERHRRHLVQAAHTELDPEAWWEGFRIAVRLEAINRVPFQWLFATAIELGYVERITRTVQALVRLS